MQFIHKMSQTSPQTETFSSLVDVCSESPPLINLSVDNLVTAQFAVVAILHGLQLHPFLLQLMGEVLLLLLPLWAGSPL